MKKLSSELNIGEELHTNFLQFSLLERRLFLRFLKLLNINKAQTGPGEQQGQFLVAWPADWPMCGQKWAVQE